MSALQIGGVYMGDAKNGGMYMGDKKWGTHAQWVTKPSMGNQNPHWVTRWLMGNKTVNG